MQEFNHATLPYRPISEFYKKRFGQKVYKIPVSVVDDCPNRQGLKGMETCIFCDQWGSAARSESFRLDLKTQIEKYHHLILKKQKAELFLIYFQAYTNTFTKLSSLSDNISLALSYPFVKGFVVGTRPDCLSKSVLNLWHEQSQKTFVSVELGVQSFFDHHLNFLKRGHSRAQSLKALESLSKLSEIDIGIHLMFGNPSETDAEIIETARICNDLKISNVKLHNLHVLKNTGLEIEYHKGSFQPIEFLDYAHKVSLFLEHLSPNIYIQRLSAFASRWDELVAPEWTANKMKSYQDMLDYLAGHRTYQGRLYAPL